MSGVVGVKFCLFRFQSKYFVSNLGHRGNLTTRRSVYSKNFTCGLERRDEGVEGKREVW